MLQAVNRCAKQDVTAIIVTRHGRHYTGTNWCGKGQSVCPRDTAGYESGQGYHLCNDVCEQLNHAEVNACQAAGPAANGGILYLFGHTYCCDDCKALMKSYGIKKIVIMSKLEEWDD